MAFVPANVVDANRRVYSLPDTDVSTNETGVALPVEITYSDFPEFFDETAIVGQGEHPYLPTPTNHYTMDNISGSTLTDEKADTNGTITNMTQTASGKFGDYLAGGSIASTQRYVDFGSSISFKSISMWVRRIATTNYTRMAALDTNTLFAIENATDGNKVYTFDNVTAYDTDLTITDTDWHHIVIVEGSTSNSHWIYVDGVKASSEVTTNCGGLFRYLSYATTTLSGQEAPDFDNFQVFDSVLTQAQVTALYNAEYPLYKKISAEQGDPLVQLPVEVSPNEWQLNPIHADTVLAINSVNQTDGATFFEDSSDSAHTISINNDTEHSVDQPMRRSSSSIKLDGTGDNLTVPDSDDFAFGTGDFWVEAWVYLSGLSADTMIISGDTSGEFFFGVKSGGNFGIGRAGVAWDTEYAAGLTTGTLYHLAAGRSGGAVYLFKDGAMVISGANNYSYDINGIEIGSQNSNYYLNGYLNGVLIRKGSCPYTATFELPGVLPGQAYSVLYLPVDADTATGAEVTISADGTQDDNVEYVGLTGEEDASLLSHALTTHYSDASTETRRHIIPVSSLSENTKAFRLKFGRVTSDTTITKCYVGYQADTGNAWDFDGNQVQVTLGGATSFSITSDGMLSDIIDLPLEGSDTLIVSISSSPRAIAYVGTLPSGCSSYLITSDVAADTAPSGLTSQTDWVYISDIVGLTPAHQVYDSNYAAVYHMAQDPSGGTDCILDSTSNANHGTPAGTMLAEDLVDSNMGKGLDFEGTDDKVVVADDATLQFGTGDYSAEVFFKPDVVTYGSEDQGTLVAKDYTGFELHVYEGDFNGYAAGTSVNDGSVSIDTWYHASHVRNSGTVTPYLNGVAGSGVSVAGSVSESGDAVTIGERLSGSYFFDGIVSEVRLSSSARSTTWNLLTAKAFLGTLWTVSAYSGGGVDILVYWDEEYDNLTVPNTQYWDSIYSILFPRTQYFDELYGMLLTAYWNMPYGNNPLLTKYWDERYGDNPLIKKWFDMPYGDRTELLKYWDEHYNLNKGLIQWFDEKYNINSKEILQYFDEGYDIKSTNPVLAFFNEYYSIMSDSVVEAKALGFYIDGVKYEGPHHVSFELNKDTFKNTGEMHFNYPEPYLLSGPGSVMEIVDTDIHLYLEVTIPTKRETVKETTYIVQAESKSRILEKAKVFTEDFLNTTAETIVTTIANREGINVDWQILDWPIRERNVNDKTPYEAIHEITSAAGAIIQSDFAGDIYVCKPMESNSNEWDTDTPTYLLVDNLHFFSTNQRGEQKPGYNKYRASDQSDSSETRTTLEDEEYAVARRIVKAFRVPWDGVGLTLHTSDNNASIQYLNIVEEELEEAISVINGEGDNKTQKPFYSLVGFSYNDVDLGTPTVTEEGLVQTPVLGQSLLTLTYRTRYYKWLVTDYDDPEIQVWVE